MTLISLKEGGKEEWKDMALERGQGEQRKALLDNKQQVNRNTLSRGPPWWGGSRWEESSS